MCCYPSKSSPLFLRHVRCIFSDKIVLMLFGAFFVIALLWVGSIWVELHFQSLRGHYFGWIADGRLMIAHHPVDYPGLLLSVWRNEDLPRFAWWFEWYRLDPFWGIDIPLWIAVLPMGLLLLLASLRAVRKIDSAHCASCGYSLKGLLHRVQICPECGSSIKWDS